MIQSPSAHLVKWSKFISNLFNPMTSLLIYFALFSLKNSTFRDAMHQLVPMLSLTVVPIFGWLFWQVRKGNYTDADDSNRQQRKGLYFVIAAVLVVYLSYTYLRTSVVDIVISFLLLLLILLQLSNYFIKSSMHTAFNLFVSALLFTVNVFAAALWLGITFLVALSRLVLRRHTSAEILSGMAIATFVSIVFLLTYSNQL